GWPTLSQSHCERVGYRALRRARKTPQSRKLRVPHPRRGFIATGWRYRALRRARKSPQSRKLRVPHPRRGFFATGWRYRALRRARKTPQSRKLRVPTLGAASSRQGGVSRVKTREKNPPIAKAPGAPPSARLLRDRVGYRALRRARKDDRIKNTWCGDSEAQARKPPTRATMAPMPFLRLAAAAAIAISIPMTSQTAQTSSPRPEPSVVRLDPALDALIPPGAKPERVATGFGFTEGPQWRHGRLWFVDGPQNELRAVTPDGHVTELLTSDSGFPNFLGPNGNAPAPDGSVVMCEQDGRRV